MLSETASAPAKLIKDFRKDEDQEANSQGRLHRYRFLYR